MFKIYRDYFEKRKVKKEEKKKAKARTEHYSLENVLARRRDSLNKRREVLQEWIKDLRKMEKTVANFNNELRNSADTDNS